MPRPIISSVGNGARVTIDVTPMSFPSVGAVLAPAEVERRLRTRRTKAYLDLMKKLDAGVHATAASAIAELIKALQIEFPELRASDLPLGIVARCYLGEPHEVHTLDCAGGIIQHYKRREPLPPNLERARSLSLHPSYAFIEVYLTSLRAIRDDGEVTVINA